VVLDGTSLIFKLVLFTVRQDCGPLEDPENGMVVVSPSTLDGSVATYSCNVGFDLGGFPTRTCRLNPPTIPGVWDGEEPTCIRMFTLFVPQHLLHSEMIVFWQNYHGFNSHLANI